MIKNADTHYILLFSKDFLSKHDDLNSRRFIGTLFLMNEIYSYRKKRDYWDKFAFLYGGPLAYNYVKMIIDRANKEKLSDLWSSAEKVKEDK